MPWSGSLTDPLLPKSKHPAYPYGSDLEDPSSCVESTAAVVNGTPISKELDKSTEACGGSVEADVNGSTQGRGVNEQVKPDSSPKSQVTTEEGTGAGGTTAPPSFKSAKARKTKSFIGSVKESTRLNVPDCWAQTSEERLEKDEDINHIFQKVATLIFGHVKDGQEEGTGQTKVGDAEDEFHEKHFLQPRCKCLPCPCPWLFRREKVTAETVLTLLSDIANSLFFCKQIVVLTAIYLERLLAYSGTRLTAGNWRSIVVVALMTASKVWEDIHPWNADFEDCMEDVAGLCYKRHALYRLESLFLDKLKWRVFVDGEVYAAYYFALIEDRPQIAGDGAAPRRRQCERMNSMPLSMCMESIREDLLEDAAELDEDDYDDCRTAGAPGHVQNPFVIDKAVSSPGGMLTHHRSQHGLIDDGNDTRPHGVRIMHKAWLLDANNPHIGAFRHAPRALAPSKHIRSSEALLWEHKLAARTVELLGPRRRDDGSSTATLSGATGHQLASELQRYLTNRGQQGNQCLPEFDERHGTLSARLGVADREGGDLSSLQFE